MTKNGGITPHPAHSGFDFDKEVEILKRETAE